MAIPAHQFIGRLAITVALIAGVLIVGALLRALSNAALGTSQRGRAKFWTSQTLHLLTLAGVIVAVVGEWSDQGRGLATFGGWRHREPNGAAEFAEFAEWEVDRNATTAKSLLFFPGTRSSLRHTEQIRASFARLRQIRVSIQSKAARGDSLGPRAMDCGLRATGHGPGNP